MSEITIIAEDIQQEVSDSQRQELEMLRKLGVIQLFSSQARTDDEHEQNWLEFFNADEDKGCVLYAAEPGSKHE